MGYETDLWQNKTNNCDSVYKLDSVLMEKEEMKLLVDIRKASCGRPADLANWPNHGAEIDRACMQYAL